MKKYLFFIFLTFIGNAAQAQCLTNSLTINTGYNPLTGLAIPGGANGAAPVPDPHWVLTAVSPAVGAAIAATPTPGLIPVVPGNKADIVTTLTGPWVSNPVGSPGGWISCVNSNTYDDQGTGLNYSMTLGRPFRMCSDDSIRITIYISSDNLTPAANIDGTIVLPAPVTGFSSYTFYTQTVWLTAGTHTLNFEVVNANVSSLSSNPMGLNVYGTVASASGINSLVSESYASCSSYNCGSTCNSISLPDSLHLCEGGKDTLRAAIIGTDSVLSLAWTPAPGLSGTSVLRPELTVGATSGWYYLTVQSLTPYNLVYNGDFTLGNTGFSSTYGYVSGANSLQPESKYAITTNPRNVHNSASIFGDHTTGTGNMMAINGSSTPTSVWCQTIPVPPNTDFAFSAWVANWSAPGAGTAPILQFQINGVLIGAAITLTSAPGTWVHFYATWNSGANTSANICIYDACTALGGNDFVLDDISFQKFCVAVDSIYADVSLVDTTYNREDTSVCASFTSITLSAPAGHSSYLWNTGSNAPAINVSSAGTYWVYAPGACAMLIDSFNVSLKPVPPTPVTRDTVYCKGFEGAAPLTAMVDSVPGTIKWYYGGSPYNGTYPSTDVPTYPNGTTWQVTQTSSEGCESGPADVTVTIVAPPGFIIASQPWVCQFDSISLAYSSSGSPLVDGGFLWELPPFTSFAGGTSQTDSIVMVRFDSVNDNNTIHLTAHNLFNGQCSNDTTKKIEVIKLPTAIAFSKPEICFGDTVSLALSSRSANSIAFAWFIDNSPLFSSGAVNIFSGNANSGGPYKITWTDTGIHVIHVQAIAEHGCKGLPTDDTVDVHQLPDATFRVTALGGTLCLEDSMLFSANDSNYQNLYSWAPEHFFNTTSKHAVWGKVERAQSIVTLTVTDPFGCRGSAARELNPEMCCTIGFPNAFTPNGDTWNDVFRPFPSSAFHRYHVFRIANRWGQTVFETTTNKAEWDGNFNGVPQELGVYFYYLKYDCDGKTMEQKGDVTLIR